MEETFTAPAPVIDAPVDPGNPKLKKFHESLVKEHAAVPVDYGQFEKTLQDPDKAKKFHEVLVKEGFAVPVDYDKFSSALELGVKKKDDTANPSPEGSEVSAPTGSTTPNISELQGQIEQALKENPEAHPEYDASLVSPEGLIPKDVLAQNYNDHALRAKLEEEYKQAVDNHTPLMTHAAGKFNQAIVDAAASIPKTIAIVSKQLDDKLGTAGMLGEGDKRNVEEYATYKAGQWIQDTAKALGITKSNPAMEQDFWASAVPNGMGSVASIVMSGLGKVGSTAAIKLMGRESYVNATKEVVKTLAHPSFVVGGTMMGVPEFEAAKKAGVSDDEAFKVFLQNYVIGQTDALPIGRALERINKLTSNSIVNVLKAHTVAGTEELIQESVQQYLTNTVAKDYYDKSRDLFDGLAQNAEAGFVVGFLFSAIGGGAAHLPKAEREKVDQFVAEKEKQYHQAFGGEVTTDHITPAVQPESQIVAPIGDLGKQPTIKPEENAIPERSAETPDVGQQSIITHNQLPIGKKFLSKDAPQIDFSEIDAEKSGLDFSPEEINNVKVLEYRGKNANGEGVGTVLISGKTKEGNVFNETFEVKFNGNNIERGKQKQQENALRQRSTTEVGTHVSGNESTGGTGESSGVGSRKQGVEIPAQGSPPQNQSEIPAQERPGGESQIKVHSQPVSQINVDKERFQNRDEAYSKKSVESIVNAVTEGTFQIKDFDPIRTWKDPGSNKTFVLSGHSRTQAFKELQSMLEKGEIPKEAMDKMKAQGVEDFKHIPSIDVSGKTEKEAIDFAQASNTMATQESDLERAKLIKKKREAGQSMASIRQETKATRGQELLSHLKPGGETWDSIKAVEGSETVENKRRVLQVGEFIGAARNNFPQLNDSHENEMFKYLTKGRGQNITTRGDFLNRIDNVVNNIAFQGEPNQPLNLDNRVTRGSNESEAVQARDEILHNIKELERERESKTKPPAEGRLNEISREIATLNKNLVVATQNIDKAKAGDKQQTDLFGTAETENQTNQPEGDKGVPADVAAAPESKSVDGEKPAPAEAQTEPEISGETSAELSKPQENESGTTTDLEPDRARTALAEQVGTEDVSKERETGERSTGQGKQTTPKARVRGEGGGSISDRIPPTDGNAPDTGFSGTERVTGITERPGRGDDGTGSSATDEPGIQAKPNTAKHPERSTHAEGTSGLNIERKLELQRQAESTAVLIKDKANIVATLPMLLSHQQDDVFKAEDRFFNPPKTEGEPNKGILFTNGTGSGKTFVGLGITKRFVKSGKKNALIVVPTETKAQDWVADGKNLLLNLEQLPDTKSAGKEGSQVVTTYANFRANEALQKRTFDLVIYDESHKLVSNEAGDQTEADRQHKELTNSPSVANRKAREAFQKQIDKDMKEGFRISEKTKELIDKEAKRLLDQTKVVFLSATPFAYHKNLRYGDGYLFTMQEGVKADGSRGYNQPSPEQAFFIKNFGYRMHYNKLTVPETGVDQSLMERLFHTSLIKSGAVSSKKLQLDKDYSREFILMDDKVGFQIDEGVKLASDNKKYRFLPAIIAKKFNYLYQNQLLEAIKAKHAPERIREHLKLGRKVVVFHSYVNSLPNHPFDLDATDISYQNERDRRVAEKEINDFHNEHPQYRALDLRDLINPVQTLQKAFGNDLLIFNGTISAGKRKAAIKDFNTDGSGKDVLVIQIESGKEGISLHDVTGVHQRAEVHLELPTRPTDAIQSEGRVYRIGQMSDAIIEYAVLHLDFEKMAFANKINTRVKTAENLAFGEEARNLEDAFKEGYKAPNQEAPREGQGLGGKESDSSFETIDQFDKAKSFYYGRGKRTAKTKAKEGKDYFATPEPLGLKMVEWLQPKPNDHLLEPSAGHGAIARWFPGDTVNKYIEQSGELRPDLAINVTGEVLSETDFEDLHAVNKFHGIAMNPPFGHAGKTAWDHVVKALDHLKDGGRVVAIVPQGGSMEKRITDWQEGEGSKNYFIRSRIKLPSVTFERAGTSVNTEILIIDKIENPEQQELIPQTQDRDWSRFESIENFFDHLREQEVPDRVIPRKDVAQILAEGGRGAIIGVVKREQGETNDFEVIQGKHTKTGVDIHTVKMNKRLTTEEYARAKSKASSLGGYYSSYRGSGATPGFIFKTGDVAKKMLDFLNGNDQDQPSTWNNEPEGYLNMASNPSKGKTPLSAFETRVFNAKGEPFKMYQKVIDLARKYNPGSTLGQNNTARGNEGTFYTPSGNIRIKGLSDLSVAMHEIVHALDFNNHVMGDFMKNTTPGDPLRKGLSKVFQEYYPGASPSVDLRKRMLEGYATLMEKYLTNPTDIKAKYPLLVRNFILPQGKYSFNQMQVFLNEVDDVIKMYQVLDPLSKIGTRVVDQRIDDDQQGYLSKSDLATRELFDALWPIEKLAKEQGTQMTSEDVSLWMRLANNAAQIAQKNISSKKNEFWTMDDKGEWSKKHDFNLNTIIRGLEKRGLTSQFGNYLVGRRIHFQYEKRNEIQDKLDKISNNPVNPSAGDAYEAKLQNQFGISAKDAAAMADKQREDFQDQIDYIQAILDNDGFSETEASDAYNAGNVFFAPDEKMFDAITKSNLEFAHNPLVQLIDDESYKEMSENKGYAPMKRQQYDELVGSTDVPSSGVTVGKTRVSSFIQRKGSQKPIINPLVGAMTNHAEIIRKGMKQMVYNKFLNVVKHNPDLFQKLPLVTTPDPKNRYPQEKDPDIIMARENYKRVPISANRQIKSVLDENFQYHNMHMLEHVGVSMSQAFRTGTTGIYFQFFINNTFLDQFSAGLNTRNGLVPFISSFKEVSRALLDSKSKEAAYLKEYLFLAGSSQTFLSADISSRKNLEGRVFGDPVTWGQQVANMMDFVTKIMSAPGNVTEIMTRFTEYSLARKAGKPQVVAREEAGRVSTPFHHMGRFGGPLGRSIVRSVPYSNSSLQVTRQSKRTLGTKEGRTKYAFAALSIIATAVATTLHFLDKDDEDRQKQILKTLTPDEMSKHLYFPNPYSDKRLLQVRIPEQLGWLSSLTMMAMIEGAKQTNYKWSEYGEAGASFLPTQMNPFNPIQMVFSYAPPLPRTAIETIAGFKSYPNIRPIETDRDKHYLAEFRYNAFTSPVAIDLGHLAGWSPKKIDHFLGGFGRAIGYLTGKPGAFGVGHIFTKELYLEASRQVQFYYTVKDRNARMLNSYEEGFKQYTPQEVMKLEARDNVLDDIDGTLEEYGNVDEKKEPMKATRLRNEIFTLIRKLENLEE